MKKILAPLGLLVFSSLLWIGCQSDDDSDGYVPINISANADSGDVFQNGVLELAVLTNDINVPENGSLVLSAPQSGSVTIIDPNGSPSILDDLVRYTPSGTYSETDSFEYTVCDAEGLSCATGEVNIRIFKPLAINVAQLPYARLSDYNFFYSDLANQEPVPGVLPYEPINSLFADYAHKKRFVWMPEGSKASYDGDGNLLNFPEGTVLVKTFYYDNVLPGNTTQIIETRIIFRRGGEWHFADYLWEESQDEALLDTAGTGYNVPIEWVQNGETLSTVFRVPSPTECFICHKSNKMRIPIGPKPQNLNKDYPYADGTSNQIQKWIETGYLDSTIPSAITTVIDWEDSTQDLELRVRSYFDMNCAHCHVDGGHCGARELRLPFSESADHYNLGICTPPDEPIPNLDNTTLIVPGDAENSILYFRVSTTLEEYRMPFTGRSLTHTEFVEILEQWINSLTDTCD